MSDVSRRSLLARLPLYGAAAAALSLPLLSTPAQAQQAFTFDKPVLGDPNAPITLVEVSSLLCPHCASFHAETLPLLREEYVDTGKINMVMKENSLGNALALGASMIVRCAPEEQYYNFIDVLFKNQRRWASAPNPMTALESYAGLMGLSRESVRACLESQEIYNGIIAGEQEMAAAGVNSTPTFLIDGQVVLVGARDIDAFREVLDERLGN